VDAIRAADTSPALRTINSTIDSTINRAYDRAMSDLTANDLKTRGVAAIEETLAQKPEAMISVRGKQRFVVMEVAQYHYLRECELDAALAESRADEAAGRYVTESAKAHMERLEVLLEQKSPARPAKAAKRETVRKPMAKQARRTSAR
jgi:hypothetical protein